MRNHALIVMSALLLLTLIAQRPSDAQHEGRRDRGRRQHMEPYCSGYLSSMESFFESSHGVVSREQLRAWLREKLARRIEFYRNLEGFQAVLVRGAFDGNHVLRVDRTSLITHFGVGHSVRVGKEGVITVFVETDVERKIDTTINVLPGKISFEAARALFSKNPLSNLAIAYSSNGRNFKILPMTIENLPEFSEPIDPSIIYDRGRYRVFFFEAAKGGIYSCASRDGISYTMEEGIRFPYKPTADLIVYRFGEIYRIFWNGIYGATSKNGMDFELDGKLLFPGREPCVFRDRDGSYRMLYGVQEKDRISTWSARSMDGITWVQEGRVEMDPGDIMLAPDGSYVWYGKKVFRD